MILPDVLEVDLRIVFCGTAVGSESSERKAYYAGSGNKFWKTLHGIGLTPRILRPDEFRGLKEYGLGLTDLVKVKAGSDSALRRKHFDIERFEQKIRRYRPRWVCFNGKKAAKEFLGTSEIDYGLLEEQRGDTRLFVAPSTSGSANCYWEETYWHELECISR